jgi:putative chitinase
MNRAAFYTAIRHSLFAGLTGAQVAGMDAILDEWERRDLRDLRQLAYMLATVLHETARRMQPIEEFGKGHGHPYGVPDPQTGKAYFGRGFVQLTWRANYEKAGRIFGVDLVHNPDRALDLRIATGILFEGMILGWFTGHKLGDYIIGERCDYVNARKIINGLDKAAPIAGYAKQFEAALKAAHDPANADYAKPITVAPSPAPAAVDEPLLPPAPEASAAPNNAPTPAGGVAAIFIGAVIAGILVLMWLFGR